MGKTLRIRCFIIALVFGVLAASGVAVAFAVGDGMALSVFRHGSGTEDDPYRIYTATQMMNLQEVSASPLAKERTYGKYFVLCNDVRISYRPKAVQYGFCGILDGNGHKVTTSSDTYLFWRLKDGAVIRNINFDAMVTLDGYADRYGVLNTVEQGATVTNCTVTAVIDVNFENVALQAAKRVSAQSFCYRNDGTVTDCTFNVRTANCSGRLSTKLYISGVAHTGTGYIKNCTVNGYIDYTPISTYSYVSGISYNSFTDNCTYNGTVRVSETALGAVKTLYVYPLGMRGDGRYVGKIESDCQYGATLFINTDSANTQYDGTYYGFTEVQE